MDNVDPKLNKSLLALLGTEALVNQWWKSSNAAFSNLTPLEMYTINKAHVIKYIIEHTTCEYS